MVQRVNGAAVDVAGERIAEFAGLGLLVLVGVTHSDTTVNARQLASKIHGLRIFESAGSPELSVGDLGLPVLVVSQFTLYGATTKGRRPTWDAAAPGPTASPLVDEVAAELKRLGAPVQTGRFGADTAVSLTNDGPMTLIIDIP